MLDKRALAVDAKYNPQNEIDAVKQLILSTYRVGEPFTASDVYGLKFPSGQEVGDITMYLALHQFVEDGTLQGLSPYDDSFNYHIQMKYARNGR